MGNTPSRSDPGAQTLALREQGFEFPECSQQIFMAKAWIEGAPVDRLADLVDVPWVRIGDLYYIQKLAETLRAARGVEWKPAAE